MIDYDEIIDEGVDQIFGRCLEAAGLDSGDCDIGFMRQLQAAKNQLALMARQLVIGNRPPTRMQQVAIYDGHGLFEVISVKELIAANKDFDAEEEELLATGQLTIGSGGWQRFDLYLVP